MEKLLDALAGAGPAVVVLIIVLSFVWRQLCHLQDKMVQTIEQQSRATADQASSNRQVAEAVNGLKSYMEKQTDSETDYRSGMKDFATTMTVLARSVETKQGEVLQELRDHREAMEGDAKRRRKVA